MVRFFFAVEIDTGDRVRLFNFCIMENAYNMICKIYADAREAVVDHDLCPLSGNMPDTWLRPAIDKLMILLNQS